MSFIIQTQLHKHSLDKCYQTTMVSKTCIHVFFNVNWWHIINIPEKTKTKNKIKYISIKSINKVNNKLIKRWISVASTVPFDPGLRDRINCRWSWSPEAGTGGTRTAAVSRLCLLMASRSNWNYTESLGY